MRHLLSRMTHQNFSLTSSEFITPCLVAEIYVRHWKENLGKTNFSIQGRKTQNIAQKRNSLTDPITLGCKLRSTPFSQVPSLSAADMTALHPGTSWRGGPDMSGLCRSSVSGSEKPAKQKHCGGKTGSFFLELSNLYWTMSE